jgi:hypothetical protein
VYFAWTPMLPADTEAAAKLVARPIDDPRAAHYWDPQRYLPQELGRALGISASESIPMARGAGAAWDVYLAYDRGDGDIRAPRFWMHQLGVKHAPRLDAEEWRRGIEGLFHLEA